MRSVCRAPSGPRWTGGADTDRARAAGLQTGSGPRFRGTLTVPFQHVHIIPRRSHPWFRLSTSHRPHHGLPSRPEEHAALPGPRHSRRSRPGTASWCVCKHTGRPDSHAIITHRSPEPPSYLVSCTSSTRCITGVRQSRLGQKVKDAKETSTPTTPVKNILISSDKRYFHFPASFIFTKEAAPSSKKG